MIVMELVPNGEVYEYVFLGEFQEEVARYYFHKLLESTYFLFLMPKSN
jgi:hypothetical protein